MSERYCETIIPYLNTNPKLDDAVFDLWGHWSKDEVSMDSAMRNFFSACAISPNIGRFEHYVPHCLQVSRRCEETGRKISENYPSLFADELNLSQMAFKGLVEDSVYLIGGDGKNNENGRDSNPYHEILTYAQMKYMGLDELANGMAMHGVASEILEIEQRNGRFEGISSPKQNISLDILMGKDFLCDRDYLPDTHGSYEDCLRFRIDGEGGIRGRRKPDHPLIMGLDNGGQEKLSNILERIRKMETGEMPPEKIRSLYGI